MITELIRLTIHHLRYPNCQRCFRFEPIEGKAGTEVTIVGVNFSTATDVAFDGKKAESFEIIDDTTIKAIVSEKTTTGPISVTNEKGTRASKREIYVY